MVLLQFLSKIRGRGNFRSPCVLVLGMHRSGTSALTGALQERGLWLGDVTVSNSGNAKGNRESTAVMDLNDAVLAANGGAWDSPPAGLAWSRDLAERRDRLLDSLRPAASGPWGFKDPRTLLTLPFWEEGLAVYRLVGTFRHPLAVAESLRDRDGMPLDRGLHLWRVYNARLLRAWERRPFPLISFDAAAGEYRRSVRRLASWLGLRGRGDEDSFFEEVLRHHCGQDLMGTLTLTADLEALYRRLTEAALPWQRQAGGSRR